MVGVVSSRAPPQLFRFGMRYMRQKGSVGGGQLSELELVLQKDRVGKLEFEDTLGLVRSKMDGTQQSRTELKHCCILPRTESIRNERMGGS